MRIYFHLDLDAFFASVEELKNPQYSAVPLIVGGKFENSVCCSANYKARSYGVKAGMPAFMYKKLLPNNYVVVNTHHTLYEKISRQIFDHIKNKYCWDIMVYSIDECWIHFERKTTKEEVFNWAHKKAQEIQEDILKNFRLSISVGISYSMFLAKMASDLKKPMGIMIIKDLKDVQHYIWPLSIDKMFMVGQNLTRKLNKLNIFTIHDLAVYKDVSKLQKILTQNYFDYLKNANGEPTIYSFRDQKPKSVSVKQTFGVPNCNDEILNSEIAWMCEQLVHNLYKNQAKVKKMQIVLEFTSKQVNKLQFQFNQLTADYETIHAAAVKLLEETYEENKLIRSLCFRVPELFYPQIDNQLSFLDDNYLSPQKKADWKWQLNVIKLINQQENKTIANLPVASFDKNKKAFNH